MKKKRVIYIVSNISKAVAFEWVVEELDSKIELEFICLNNNTDTSLVRFLKQNQIPVKEYKLGSKIQMLMLWLKLFILLLNKRPNVIHTHLFEASLLGLSAAKLAGVKNRIYTRHYSIYHHKYFPKMVKYDRMINSFSTKVIAISKNVYSILKNKEGVNEEKIELVEHGFKLEKFKNIPVDEVLSLKGKYDIPENKWTVGIVSRYIKWKGVEYGIRAFNAFKKKYPNTHLILANSGGPYQKEIKEELNKLTNDSFTEIPFEENLFALYQLFDCFVHCPIDDSVEAFGQTYIESLASEVPSIFTKSGIANDFIVHDKNAFVVDYKSSLEIELGLNKIFKEEDYKKNLKANGLKSVEPFALKSMIVKLESLYDF